ncbi:hypothetical protein HNR01_005600 [Methylorubrum rhodesianum]|uniref:hypothetical protein n=1 Tax=Methylorubrum rhodesianum TaxID=29427 RepID=UPI00160F8104|nr:hypothetical protein [Methylorubrum rhodesianum]MBB5765939.1 hypothetical protein [Methylorubrum rhodesianum]
MSQEYYYILCPPHAMTGGPEALHQLGNKLIKLGKTVYMIYFHGSVDEIVYSQTVNHDRVLIIPQYNAPVHEAYKHYNIPYTSCIVDNARARIIIPEIWPHLIDKFLGAETYYWWLSFDYGYQAVLNNEGFDVFRASRHINLVQSNYAKKKLESLEISDSYVLSDYTSPNNFCIDIDVSQKKNLVLYNRKGQSEAERLAPYIKNCDFELIANMSPEQVRNKMAEAKAYIDFGPHPGMDRMPREAAASQCCVMTGLRGSASHFEDVPIPSMYKIDTRGDYFEHAGNIIEDIISNYDRHLRNFDYYRRKIAAESDVFESQIKNIFANR